MRPYGYDVDRTTVRDDEAKLLREAARRLLDGDSLRTVTTWANESGARTPGGNTWKPNVLRRVLISPRVAGKVQGKNGKLRDADWPAILDAVTYKRLVDFLTDESRNRGGAQATRTYLLTGGISVCGLCGTQLIARPNNDGKRGYVCASGAPSYGCGRIRINADLLENEVVERVLARLLREDARERLAAMLGKAKENADAADDKIAAAERRLKDLGTDYADGLIGRTEFHAARTRLQQQIQDARTARRLGDSLESVAALEAEDLVAWWEGASLPQQRALLDALVSKVEVLPVQVRGSKKFDPGRVKVVWRRR